MMINWHEMNNHGRTMVETRRQEAAAYRLEQLASEQYAELREPAKGGIGRTLRNLVARVFAAGQRPAVQPTES